MTSESKKIIMRLLDFRISEIQTALISIPESVTKHDYNEYLHNLKTAKNELLQDNTFEFIKQHIEG